MTYEKYKNITVEISMPTILDRVIKLLMEDYGMNEVQAFSSWCLAAMEVFPTLLESLQTIEKYKEEQNNAE